MTRNEFTHDLAMATKFYNDPVGWSAACLHWPVGQNLTAYQAEILAAVPREKRVAVRGPHGLGKSSAAAILVLWFAVTREAAGIDWKIVTTAGAWRQLERYLWPEIIKWARRLDWAAVGCEPWDERTQLLSLNIKLANGQAFAVASDNYALIEGAHADAILYVLDEAKSIIPAVFDAAEGAFAGAGVDSGLEAFALAASTPGEPNGRFFDIHTRKAGLEDWWTRHVTVDESIAAGRISQDWVDQRRKQWGKDSALFANRVLGEFHSSDEDGVIPLEWIEAANARWQAWDDTGRPTVAGPRRLGVDVARFGGDKTVMAILDRYPITGDQSAGVVTELRRSSQEDTMQTVGRVAGIVSAMPGLVPIVDVIGVGGGVVDRLREQGVKPEAFNASESTNHKDRSGELGFVNKRAGAWWCLRERLDPAYGASLALPPDDLLTGDLTSPHYSVTSNGRIQIESKDDIRKRIGRSPDSGDAVVQACWEEAEGPSQAWIGYWDNEAKADGIEIGHTTRDWRQRLADARAGKPPAPSAPPRTSPDREFPKYRRPGPDKPPWCRNG